MNTPRATNLQAIGQQDHRHRIAWADAAQAYPRMPYLTQTLMIVGIFGLAVLDSYLMMPALQSVLRLPVDTTEKVAYGVSAAAALSAGWTGYQLRGAVGNHPGSRQHLILPAIVGTSWLLLGVVIAIVRLVGTTSRANVSYDGAPPAATGIPMPTWTAAGLFLIFYLLVGALALGDLYHLRQDAVSALRRAIRGRSSAVKELRPQEALLRRLVEVVSIRQLETQLLTAQADIAKVGNAAHALELKQLSRYEQAVHLGSPSGTGITSPDHEKNPAAVADSLTSDRGQDQR